MNTRYLVAGVSLLLVGFAAAAALEGFVVSPARAAVQNCSGPDDCARARDHRSSVQYVEFAVLAVSGALMGVGSLLLLAALALDEPLPAALLRGVEPPPVSWRWRRWNVGPEVRIPLLLLPFVVISAVSQNLIVMAFSFAVFATPLALRRRRLSPGLVSRSFLLALGATTFAVGLMLGGVSGVIVAALLVLTASTVAFVIVPKL